MIPIPGVIIAILTFPGVIVHEAAHQLFCRLRRVPVYDVVYFQFDMRVSGYVEHGDINDFTSAFLVSVGPLILNTLLCLAITFPASLPYYVFGDRSFITYALLWIGVSIGMHAFPSNVDASHVWQMAKTEARKKNVLAILSFPLVVAIYIANVLRFLWFDAIYGFFIGVILPSIVFGAL